MRRLNPAGKGHRRNEQCTKASYVKGETVNANASNVYQCHYVSEPIKIDGLLEEPVWDKAQVLEFMIPTTHGEPIGKTQGKLLWDKNYLYVGFKAYDKDIWSYFTQRDSHTCQEDVLEVFVKPYADAEPYYNFEINAINTVYDACNLKRGAGGSDHHRWSRWDCQGLKSAVFIKGTLNNSEDVDEYWQLEVAIPFADLPTLKGKMPVAGDNWQFHLARYDHSVYLDDGPELSSCAPLSKVNFHRYEDWLTLKFVK